MAIAGVNFGWIGALHAPTLIVNWTNLPTGFGEVTHVIVNWFGNVPEQPFVNLFRFLGILDRRANEIKKRPPPFKKQLQYAIVRFFRRLRTG